jgi:glucose/arabinose dehydrogenase
MPLVHRGLLATVLLVAAACSPAPSPVPAGPSGTAQAATAPPSGTPARTSSALPSAPAAGSPGASAVASVPTTAFDPTGVVPVVRVVTGGLTSPLDVADAGDGSGRIFVAEQAGRIRIVRDGTLVEQPFLDISDRIASGGERGLLGIAFHPGYPTDPRVFVDYTDKDGNTVVSSFRVIATDPDAADPASEAVLLHVTQPFPNHNGGGIHFGPDGMLYIALGDGGSGGDPQGNGQRLDTLLAKILRIDVDGASGTSAYAVPPDNPFLATAGARPEIWLTGLRNPWRFSFDGPTGDLWIGDVGQALWEEIDVARHDASGLDFGWNVMEGFHCFQPSNGCDQANLTLPVAEYGHDLGCAVIGGVVVRDARQGRLDGGYLFGDACSDNLWLMDPNGNGRREPVIVARMGRTLSSIDATDDGTVYATALGSGELLRISGPGG